MSNHINNAPKMDAFMAFKVPPWLLAAYRRLSRQQRRELLVELRITMMSYLSDHGVR